MRKKEIHAVSIIHRVHEHRVHNHPSRLNFDSFIHSHAQSRGSPLDRRSRVRIRPERATTPSFLRSSAGALLLVVVLLHIASLSNTYAPVTRIYHPRRLIRVNLRSLPAVHRASLFSLARGRRSIQQRIQSSNPIQSSRRGRILRVSIPSVVGRENETKRTNSRSDSPRARCPGPLRSRRRAGRRLSPGRGSFARERR